MEVFRPVLGYEGLYEVSNTGKVRSLRHGRYKILKLALVGRDKNAPYLAVSLCKESRQKTYRVHRLVAIAFINNPEKKPVINHKDSNRHNNHVSNLEWNTHQENVRHCNEKGRNPTDRKLNDVQVINIRHMRGCITQDEIARGYGVSQRCISYVISGTYFRRLLPRKGQ